MKKGLTTKVKNFRRDYSVLTFTPLVVLTNHMIFTAVFEISSESQILMQFPRRKCVFFSEM